MSFVKKRIEYIDDVDEFNRLLKIARDNRLVKLGPCTSREVGPIAYIDDKLTTIELTLKQGKACTYVFNKTFNTQPKTITGLDAYIQLAKSFVKATGYKIPEYDRSIGSATALLGYRPDIADHQRVQAVSYDVNSAYGWAMTQPMPDTRKPAAVCGRVGKNQVGFIVDDEEEIDGFITSGTISLQMVHEGRKAEFIFDLMDSPFTEFANKWYKKKSEPKNQDEKDKAKQMLCYSVGYLQRKNPFLRAAIVEYTNQFIRSLIDKNTIYVNTDCIISTEPRELPIGKAMGQFKKDHEGMFANSGFNYQWDLEIPKYRGIPKAWFPENWDILTDPVPCNRNIYELNGITLQMEAYNG